MHNIKKNQLNKYKSSTSKSYLIDASNQFSLDNFPHPENTSITGLTSGGLAFVLYAPKGGLSKEGAINVTIEYAVIQQEGKLDLSGALTNATPYGVISYYNDRTNTNPSITLVVDLSQENIIKRSRADQSSTPATEDLGTSVGKALAEIFQKRGKHIEKEETAVAAYKELLDHLGKRDTEEYKQPSSAYNLFSFTGGNDFGYLGAEKIKPAIPLMDSSTLLLLNYFDVREKAFDLSRPPIDVILGITKDGKVATYGYMSDIQIYERKELQSLLRRKKGDKPQSEYIQEHNASLLKQLSGLRKSKRKTALEPAP